VVRTQVGYAGGTTPNPTYNNIGDYSETVQLEFDPAVISYDQLLQAFWSGHNPAFTEESRQYRSAVFYVTEEQRTSAVESRQREESAKNQPLFTQIEELRGFYYAEDYHQKYFLRGNPEILAEIGAIYPAPRDLINSTAAARLNGYLGGYGSQEMLQKQLNSLGLSEAGQKKLLQITASGLSPGCPPDRCNP
jgi:peptide-methionine (S)-S-oxide reductase